MKSNPSLYGISKSNRDFSLKDSWGKNQFNSSFPVSLACYMYSKGLPAVYYAADEKMNIKRKHIDIKTLYGIEPLGDDIYFSFETQYTPFQKYITGSIPRNDVVVMSDGECISSLEIKLTALPDNSTSGMTEDKYGKEIVVRPDTIIYLACSFIKAFYDDRNELKKIIAYAGDNIRDWTEAEKVIPYTYEIYLALKRIVAESYQNQTPVIMQPVWKTEGKSPKLSDNCLDVFIWSNCSLLALFMPSEQDFELGTDGKKALVKITRHSRTMIWLFRMIKDFALQGYFSGAQITDELSYNLKNDKAFASNGLRTHTVMACPELKRPRITKDEIKNIILGGGQEMLSPERRFDAIIYNSPDLF